MNSFIEKTIQHLKDRKVPIDRIITWLDNAGPQYKSWKVFDNLSKMKIPVLQNYFGAKHGKGDADGAIGQISQIVDVVVCSGTDFGDCKELTHHCQKNLTLGVHKPGMCCHKHQDYCYIGNINCIDDKNDTIIPGTQSFHSARNTGKPGIIETWASTCFPSVCMVNLDLVPLRTLCCHLNGHVSTRINGKK